MIEAILRTVLYEGYALYPYRPSALKNHKRFAFGVVYPRAWAERALEVAFARVEVVADAPATTAIGAAIHYLQLARGGGAREQAIELAPHALGDPPREVVVARDGIALAIETSSARDGDLWRVAIEIRNATELPPGADRDDALDASPASTHVVLTGAPFISAIDPPARAVAAVAACRSTGLYPVLVGADAMLASPIILPDHPQIAPQSAGDYFDGTEIDEMLALRVLTMTDAEKHEAARDPRVAALIARTEELGPGGLARLHGVARTWPRAGTRVVVRPHRSADAQDFLLAGRRATVASVERDLDGRVHCAVTLDDDEAARSYFFAPDELEVIA